MLPVLIVGGGPAGLATAAVLRRRGIAHRILERGPALAHSWVNAYDSLTLHTGKHMSALPGRSFPRGTPLFPTRDDFVHYLRDYALAERVEVETGREVQQIQRGHDGWMARAGDEVIHARFVVMATGIMAAPRVPALAGRDAYRGRVLHSVEYRNPREFIGHRVLVLGAGNSGGEIGSELAHAGAQVTVAVRSGVNVVPREIAGIPIQYIARTLRPLPPGARRWIAAQVQRLNELRRGPPVFPRATHSALDAIPLIGFHLVDAIRAGKVAVKTSGLERFTLDGVQFSDGSEAPFDVVLMATGFNAAIAPLGNLVTLDAKGFARRTDRVTSADAPDLFFVGHNYDATGGLANIRHDAPLAVAAIERALGKKAN